MLFFDDPFDICLFCEINAVMLMSSMHLSYMARWRRRMERASTGLPPPTAPPTATPTSRPRSARSLTGCEVQGIVHCSNRCELMFNAVYMRRSPPGARWSDLKCGPVLFFRTRAPIEPVSFVHKICSDALALVSTKRHRWVRRLTPMSRMGKATEKGLDAVAKAVLAPAFHDEGGSPKKVFPAVWRSSLPLSLTVPARGRCTEPGS